MLDARVTLSADAGKGERANEKENMARRRYQTGCLFIRGKKCRKVWVARWREEVLQADSAITRTLRSVVLGSVSELSKSDAHKLLVARLLPINQGLHRPQAAIPFSGFVAEHFEPGILPTLKFATQQIYAVLLRKHLLPRFGHERLCDIGKMEIQRFVLDKLALGLAWETVNHLRHLLSKVLGTAVEWSFLTDNAARGVKMPERTLKRPRGFLTAVEVGRLLGELGEPSRTIVALAAGVGLRIGEILALRWGRIDFDRGTLRVEETCYKGEFGTPKTRASRREVPIPMQIVQMLQEYRTSCSVSLPDALVFCTRKGTPLAADNLRKRELAPACERAKIRADWHTLRHTHSTQLHAQGTPLKYAQAQLGHSRISTTYEVYTHTMTDGQRNAISKLAEDLFPSVPKSAPECSRPSEATTLIQ